MKAAGLAALLLVFATAAGAGFRPGYTTPLPGGASAPLVIVTGAPDKEYAGPGMAVVPNAQLIEEKDGNVVVRTKAHPSTFIFGMHTMARSQVHKLEDEKKK